MTGWVEQSAHDCTRFPRVRDRERDSESYRSSEGIKKRKGERVSGINLSKTLFFLPDERPLIVLLITWGLAECQLLRLTEEIIALDKTKQKSERKNSKRKTKCRRRVLSRRLVFLIL